MAQKEGKQLALDERRTEVAALYMQGWSQRKIAEHFDLSQHAIFNDLESIRKELKASRIRNFESHLVEEILKIEVIEYEAKEAWERSKRKGKQRRRSREYGKDPKTTVEAKHQDRDGDPRFLDILNRCSDRMCKLLRLYEESLPIDPADISDDMAPNTARSQFDRVILLIAERRGANGAATVDDGNGQAVVDAGKILPGDEVPPSGSIS